MPNCCPLVLNIAANDSAGLAGLMMDVRTQTALGVHSASVVTANTAQNNQSVISINAVTESVFSDQLKANASLPIQAIKVGLVAHTDQITRIKAFAQSQALPLVLDPVLKSSSGFSFSDADFISAYTEQLLSACTLLTPNIDEAEMLAGLSIHSATDIETAASRLLSLGAAAVFVKGGHFSSATPTYVQDYFTDGQVSFWLSSERVDTVNTRGTGCALSSAIASSLALGYSLYDAVVIGKMAISQGLRQAYELEQEVGPVHITHFPEQESDLPVLSQVPLVSDLPKAFPNCNKPLLGLYPVVDRAEWLKTLAAAGVSTIQLRVKDLQGDRLEKEIQQAVIYANQYNMRLFVNDYWQQAIRYKAYGVHLGQEDLDKADIDQIRSAGLRLGIRTCEWNRRRMPAPADCRRDWLRV